MPDPNLPLEAAVRHPAASDDDFRFDNWREARSEPDVVLPAQFNDLIRRRHNADGEVRLALAVLEDAIRTYIKCAPPRRSRAGKKMFEEVAEWFRSRGCGPFSFEYICELLDMHSDSLRKRLDHLTIDDFPAKQTHSVGRRQIMRPRASRRRHAKLHPAMAARPGNMNVQTPSPLALLTASIEQPD